METGNKRAYCLRCGKRVAPSTFGKDGHWVGMSWRDNKAYLTLDDPDALQGYFQVGADCYEVLKRLGYRDKMEGSGK